MQWENSTREDIPETSSPYGPYIKTGRGGAGNHIWQSDLEKRRNEDPEADLPSTTAEAMRASEIPRSEISSNQSTYIATGRGGSGNYTAASSQNTSDPTLPRASTYSQSKQTVRTTPDTPIAPGVGPYRGRGGAGNFEASSATQHAKEQREEKERLQKETEVRKAVVEDVETGLQKPPGAWIQVPEGRERE